MGIQMRLETFLKINVQKGDFLGLSFQIFCVMLDIPDFFGVNSRCWV